jgi:hypothetical protein
MKKIIFIIIILIALAIALFAVMKFFKPTAVVNNNLNTNQPTPSNLETYTDNSYNFSIQYPKDDVFSQGSQYAFAAQNSLISINLPESYYPGTNLGEASVIIGVTSTPALVNNCLQPQLENEKVQGVKNIDNKEFIRFIGEGVGAGNIYDTTSYRLVYNNSCYEIVLLMHSGNIGNYPTGAVKEFDRLATLEKLNIIAETFKFL